MKKGGHRLSVRAYQGANSEINVTPLVDVVLVLLIIFMVVTPLVAKDIPVQTPSESAEAPLEPPVDQIIVYLAKGGRVTLNAEPVEPAQLETRLLRILQPRAVHDRVVFVVAHDDCSYGELVRVLDAARGAGAAVVGVPTDPPEPRTFL
jgi:biopolymer transport protein TolR